MVATRRSLERAEKSGDQARISNLRRTIAQLESAQSRPVVASSSTPKVRAATGPKKAKRAAKVRSSKPDDAARFKRTRESSTARDPGSIFDSGIRYSLDPDADRRTVWAFKSGSSFHRRDCQVVEARDGAIEIPIAMARKRNLERCMHCVPSVR